MEKYQNRIEAGQILANNLQEYINNDVVIVLALPRGGVPVAYEIAKTLNAPLDVFIVRKLGVPGHGELAMGALSEGNKIFFNEDIIRDLHISKDAIFDVIEKEKQELERRQIKYRGNTKLPDIKNKIVVLVDDGIATGATMRVAIMALREMQPSKIIVAVPVADKHLIEKFRSYVDELVCPLLPEHLYAVGIWYNDFTQTEDQEVEHLLKLAKQFSKR